MCHKNEGYSGGEGDSSGDKINLDLLKQIGLQLQHSDIDLILAFSPIFARMISVFHVWF